MASIICPPQSSAPIEPTTGLLSRLWWLFFAALAKAVLRSNFIATCGTGLALTDTYQDIADCTGTLPTGGLWVVVGVFWFTLIGPAENGAFGRLQVDGVAQDAVAQLGCEADFVQGTVMQLWPVNVAAGATINMQAKTNVTGSGHLNPDSTRLFALLVTPL